MAEISGAQFRNLSASEVVKTGVGKVYGIVVNSHSSGTIKLYDGVDNTAGAKATGTLTLSGAGLVPAAHATTTLTSTGTNVTDGGTVTIGSVVYRFKDTPAAIKDVQIGASASATLDNLKAAINGSGTPGTEYFAGTTAHPLIIAGAKNSTTIKLWSRTYGTANNTLDTTSTETTLSFEDTTFGGGTGASDPGVATAAATFSINGESYYFTKDLQESVTGTAIPNEILWVTNDATALDNMKTAINGTGTEGTDYSTGTNANLTVIATTNTNTAQTIEARVFGSLGNQVTTTEGMANAAWGASTLTGGTDAARLILNTFTFASGSQVVTFPEPINFVNGLYVLAGGSALDATVIYN